MSWGAYGLLAYHLPWYGVTPYTEVEYNPEVVSDVRIDVLGVHGGVNVHPIDAVAPKGAYTRGTFLPPGPFFRAPMQSVQSQLAWAFCQVAKADSAATEISCSETTR